MYSENPFFESIDNWVIVWIGDLNNAELAGYLDEPGGESEPISAFARHHGQWQLPSGEGDKATSLRTSTRSLRRGPCSGCPGCPW